MTDPTALEPDSSEIADPRSRRKDATAQSYALARPSALLSSARESSTWQSDARVTIVGLASVVPFIFAMMAGSTVLVVLASVVALAVSALSPITGLIALAFIAPFPRPLVIPLPGLHLVMIGAILLGIVLRLPIERPRLARPSLEVLAIGAFLVYVTAQFVVGMLDGPPTGRGRDIASLFSQITTTVLTFVVASLVLRGRSPYPVLAALLLSAALATATALSQTIGADQYFGDLKGQLDVVARYSVDRIIGPFSDPNYFGAYLAAATTLGAACAVVARSMRLRVVLIALSAFVGTAMMLTLSRGALVALIAGLVTIAFTRGRRAGIATVAAMLLLVVVAWPMFADVRFAANPDIASGGLGSQLQGSDRTGAWLGGLEVFLSAPLFGVGWGRLVEEASTGILAHNWYVAVLGELGIVGFALWASFIVSSILALRRKSSSARTIGYSVLAAWMVASLFLEVPVAFRATALVLIVLAAAITADWTPRGGGADRPSVRRRRSRA